MERNKSLIWLADGNNTEVINESCKLETSMEWGTLEATCRNEQITKSRKEKRSR